MHVTRMKCTVMWSSSQIHIISGREVFSVQSEMSAHDSEAGFTVISPPATIVGNKLEVGMVHVTSNLKFPQASSVGQVAGCYFHAHSQDR